MGGEEPGTLRGRREPAGSKTPYKGSRPLFFQSLINNQPAHSHLPVQTPQCQPGPRLTLREGKSAKSPSPEERARRARSTPAARPSSAFCRPTPHAGGCRHGGARAAGGACAQNGGGWAAPRAGRWARPLARVRAPRLLPHVPRAPRPLPAGSARPPPSRQVPLSISEPHAPRSSCHGRRVGRGSLARRLSLSLGAASQASSPPPPHPFPFPPFSPTQSSERVWIRSRRD